MLDDMGEEAIFEGYLRLGTVQKLVNDLFEVHGDGENVSPMYFYNWLHEDPARWERWQEVQRMRGTQEFERVQEIAGEIDAVNYREKKVEADVRQWIAQRLNKDYSHRVQHEVSGEVEHKWLSAMEEIEGAEMVEVADYEITDGSAEGEGTIGEG